MQNILDKFRLDNKIALVTGGTSGIGFSLAVGLAQAGAKIFVNDIRDEKLDEAKREFGKLGIDAFVLKFNVSDETDVDQGISMIEKEVGNIDILINNAGKIKRSLILEMPVPDFKQVLEINLVSKLIVVKRVVPNMIKNGGGKIINICSLMSEYGRNSVSAYASAKGGLKLLTRNMCCEWAKYNIQVNGQTMLGCEKTENAGKDLKHIWLYAALKNNRCAYYSGFGWKKAGRFNSEERWKEYIREQVFILENPLSITVN